MSLPARRAHSVSGDPSTAVSLALHRLVNDLVESVFALPDFERCLLILAAPGFEDSPSWQVSLWAARDGAIAPIQAPEWFDYEAVVIARRPGDDWDHVALLVEAEQSTDRGERRVKTTATARRAGEDLLGLLFDAEVAHALLYPV